MQLEKRASLLVSSGVKESREEEVRHWKRCGLTLPCANGSAFGHVCTSATAEYAVNGDPRGCIVLDGIRGNPDIFVAWFSRVPRVSYT